MLDDETVSFLALLTLMTVVLAVNKHASDVQESELAAETSAQGSSSILPLQSSQPTAAAPETIQHLISMLDSAISADLPNTAITEAEFSDTRADAAAASVQKLRLVSSSKAVPPRRSPEVIIADMKSRLAKISSSLTAAEGAEEFPSGPIMVTAIAPEDPFTSSSSTSASRQIIIKSSSSTEPVPGNTKLLIDLYERLSHRADIKLHMRAQGRTGVISPTTPETKQWDLLEKRVFAPVNDIRRDSVLSSMSGLTLCESTSKSVALLSSSTSSSTISQPRTPKRCAERPWFLHIPKDWEQGIDEDIERLELETPCPSPKPRRGGPQQ